MTIRIKLVVAFAVVYLIWGSTYTAIRIVVETFPPTTMAALRFLISGPILLLFALWRGASLPRKFEEYRSSAIIGIFLLVGGNGILCWAEQFLESGFSSLIVATAPIWMVGFERFWKKGERLGWLTCGGVFTGLIGVFLLMWPEIQAGFFSNLGGEGNLFVQLLLLCGSLSWAFGSIYAKHAPTPKDPMMTAALQMISGGIGLALVSLVRGEITTLEISEISQSSILAWVYLVIFGGCLGFTAYLWLLKNAPAAKVATHAYVNPVVAVLLGVTLLNEKPSLITLMGMIVILAGVIMVSKSKIRPLPQTPEGGSQG